MKKKRKKFHPVKKTLALIGTLIVSLFLLVIITGSIIAAALTVYIMQFASDADLIDITNVEMDYTTFIYAPKDDGTFEEIKTISRNADRIPIEIEQIPQHVQDAFVYIEDERFYEHDGVDWKRTFGAFMNEFLSIWGSRQGGSTITQQLVKNVTGDDDTQWDRKVREIFRASKLEEYYLKPDILEAYLNFIGFGGATAGIQAASLKYFDKDVWELDIAEAAALAAIPKNPNVNNPYALSYDSDGNLKYDDDGNPINVGLENNRERQILVLDAMLRNNAISEEDYDAAVAKKMVFAPQYKQSADGTTGVQSWFVDEAIRDVTLDLAALYGVSFDEASDMLYNGGYEIQTTVDLEMQKQLEAEFADYTNFSENVLNDPPQASFICMDYSGNIKAVVGGIGQKSGDNIFNRATRALRSPGSCIKPITSYGYGIENNLITWSTVFVNKPLKQLMNEQGEMVDWPRNYNTIYYDEAGYFTFQALQRSLNTVAAALVDMETPASVFDFLQGRFHITSLSPFDADLAPMSVGSLTNGITLEELVAAYQPFGNQGFYYEPTTYTKVLDSEGRIILEHKYIQFQALQKDSAFIMNKLMRTVTEGPNGTGRAAKLPTTPVAAKTGTSQDWHDLTFVACTPDYVSGVWYGYDVPSEVKTGTYYSSAQVWANVFGEIAEAGEHKEFPPCSTVEEVYYCARTGLRASATCPTGDVGYYKQGQGTGMALCHGVHPAPEA
ncbi:MAG: penicillin-binding protein [Ruminococcus sp.]|jgi:penicillin-binding protein 1A|nr:penicillin-binding protein [Ruminococcus sp.]